MDSLLENPVKNIRRFNIAAFVLLLIALLVYQINILIQHNYISEETVEFDLGNQDRLLSQQIERDLTFSVLAPDDLIRNHYLNQARQNMNVLFTNHKALSQQESHPSVSSDKNGITQNIYVEADFYLENMRDAVLMAVASSESQQFSAQHQQSIRHAVDNYRQNQRDFVNLIDHATDLSSMNAKIYMARLPWISWSLVGLIFIVMLLNHVLIHERSVKTAKAQFYQLAEKLEFQEALLNSTYEAIIKISPDGIITLFSASASRIFGYSANEVVGKSFFQLIAAHSRLDYQEQFKNNLEHIQHLETCGLRQNGETFPLLLHIEELKTERQHTLIGFIRDLTVEKTAEAKLIKAKKEAEEANQAKSQFLSNMSHELKTPLNAILGFSQLLETNDGEPLSQLQTEWVKHIYKAGKLLMALISDILDLSKIETGHVKLHLEEVLVNEVILDALNLIENIAKEQHINIKTRFDPLAETYIKVDDLRFKQVLINLLSNAIKYNSEHGMIVLSSKIEHNRVKISIKDSGKGIDEAKLMELFQPFNRLGAEKSNIEGTGIGLCIAKNLVERMGGTIGVRNNKTQGCCFWVEFPIIEQKVTVKENATELTKNLQDELAYIQKSLHDISLIKKTQSPIAVTEQFSSYETASSKHKVH